MLGYPRAASELYTRCAGFSLSLFSPLNFFPSPPREIVHPPFLVFRECQKFKKNQSQSMPVVVLFLLLPLLPLLLLTTITSTSAQDQLPCPVVIDIRAASDYTAAHVSCSISVPSADIDLWLELIKLGTEYEKNTPFYIYCYAGVLAGRAQIKFIKNNYNEARNGGGYSTAKNELEKVCDLQTKCLSGEASEASSSSPSTSPSASEEEDSSVSPSSSTKSTSSKTINRSELPATLHKSHSTSLHSFVIIYSAAPLLLSAVILSLLL